MKLLSTISVYILIFFCTTLVCMQEKTNINTPPTWQTEFEKLMLTAKQQEKQALKEQQKYAQSLIVNSLWILQNVKEKIEKTKKLKIT